MNKTAREWFEELPSPIREMAVENAKNANVLEEVCDTLTKAIDSFIWDETTQDWMFWHEVSLGNYDEALARIRQRECTIKECAEDFERRFGKGEKLPKHIPHRHKFSPIKFN